MVEPEPELIEPVSTLAFGSRQRSSRSAVPALPFLRIPQRWAVRTAIAGVRLHFVRVSELVVQAIAFANVARRMATETVSYDPGAGAVAELCKLTKMSIQVHDSLTGETSESSAPTQPGSSVVRARGSRKSDGEACSIVTPGRA